VSTFKELDRQFWKSIERWENEGGAPAPSEWVTESDDWEDSPPTPALHPPRAPAEMSHSG